MGYYQGELVDSLQQKNEQWSGFINTGYFAGSIIGGILIALWSTRLQQHLIRGIIVGPFYQLRDITQQTYIQQCIKDELLAKFYAAKDNMYYLVFALSVLVSGLISDFLGVVYVYGFAALER
ncbi:hypothetical protein D3C78_1634460 [compost metagenome]